MNDFFKNDDRRDEAIVLIDPDFLFLTRFDLGDAPLIEPGRPAAAKYGLGGQFLDFNLTQICNRAPPIDTNTTNPDCPFKHLTSKDVNSFVSVLDYACLSSHCPTSSPALTRIIETIQYNVGPPYVMHIQDVQNLSQR